MLYAAAAPVAITIASAATVASVQPGRARQAAARQSLGQRDQAEKAAVVALSRFWFELKTK
eukprot:6206926-Pleurochrysis_carterae.AAC.1